MRALEGLELFGKLAVFYIAAQNAGRHVLPEGDGVVVNAVLALAVDDVIGQKLHHIEPCGAAEVAAAAEARVDLKEHIAPRAAVVLHVDVRKADVAKPFKKFLHLVVQCLVAAGNDGGIVADGLGVVVFEHRLTKAHRAHMAVQIGIAVEHAHGVVAAGNKLLQDELAAIVRAVHIANHFEVLLLRVKEEYLLLAFKVTAEIVERVGIFGLDDDGEVKRQPLGDALTLLGRGDDGLGIVHAVLLAEGVELVLRVKGLKKLFGDEAVRDQAFKVVVVAAEKTRIIVRAGDNEQLFIVLRALLQNLEQRVGENLLALKIRDDAAEKQVRVARGHKLLRAQQQRRDAVGLAEEARRAVGIFIAAEDNGQKILF